MRIQFKNIKGDTYFIKKKLTKKGNTTYYMTRKQDDECLDKIPKGYEVFEKYDSGMMFIRKIKQILFSEKEIKVIKRELEENKTLADYKLDINGDVIKIYTIEKVESNKRKSSQTESLFERMLQMNMISRRYEERMRFYIEETKNNREYRIQRYCYRGRIDDWINLDWGEELEPMAKEYLVHLGKESYYDLM